MKTNTSLRSLLGITQEEAAQLLQTTRSQLSLYELGKRELPAKSFVKLAELWVHVEQANKIPKEAMPYFKEQQIRWQEQLREEIKENRFQQMKLQRKLQKIEGKFKKCCGALQVVAYLETQTEDQTTAKNDLLKWIAKNAKKGIERSGWHAQEECRLALQALQQHEKLMQISMASVST
jgi:transcriptional regulator with XRE-family HTH domain